MIEFIFRRLMAVLPLALGVSFIVMWSFTLVPGDPAQVMLGEFASPQALADLRASLGLDKPLLQRYVSYIGSIFQGDLGNSLMERRPVVAVLGDAFPRTLQLALFALALAIALGIPLGLLASVYAGSWIDGLVRIVSLAGLSMPVFWTGLMFVILFSVNLGWFPVSGVGSWRHLVLPALTLALPSLAVVSRMTRASLMEVRGEDYIRTARAKGMGSGTILLKHTLKNALIPIITVIGLQLGQMLGGAVLTETVFAIPGLGRLAVFAISSRDYVLVQGVVLVLALLYLLLNLVVDLSYGLIDPRVSYS